MRSWLKWLLFLVGAVVVLLAVVYVYIFHAGGLERYVVREVNEAIAEPGNLRVTLRNIKGDLFTGVVVEGLNVQYVDSSRSFTLAKVENVTAQYALSDIWQGSLQFESIYLSGVELTVARTEDGRWLVPIPATAGAEGGTPTSFSVNQFGIHDASITVHRDRDTLKITNLDLTAAVRREGRSLSLDIQRLGYGSSDPVLALDNLSGQATLTGDTLLFQDLLLVKGGTRLKASGTVDIRSLSGDVELSVDGLRLEHIKDLTGARLRGEVDLNGDITFSRQRLTGRANVGGNFLFADLGNLVIDFDFANKLLSLDTVYGTVFGSCGIDGRGMVDFGESPEQYGLSADIRDFDLNRLIPGTFASDLTGRLELRGESFSSATMRLEMDVDLYESSFDEYPLQRAVGRLLVTRDSLTFPIPLAVDYFENNFRATGTIDYDDDIYLEVEADLANLDRYRGRLFINQPGGRGRAYATLSGLTADPDLAGRFWSDSLWVYGLYADTAYADFDIERFLTGRQGIVDVDLFSGSVWDVPYDTGYALIVLDSSLVILDSVALFNSFARLDGGGLLDQNPYPWRLTIDTLSLSLFDRQYYNKSQMLIEIDTLGFGFVGTTIGRDQASISADRRINYDETMDLTVRTSGIPLAPWLQLFGYDYGLDGVVSGSLDFGGTFSRPLLTLDGILDSVAYKGEVLGQLVAGVRYRDGLVDVDSVVMLSDHGVYRAEGELRADLSFAGDVERRLPDEPFDIRFTALDTDSTFKLVPLLLPSVEFIGGNFRSELRLDGTPSQPHLDGYATLKNGRLKYLDLVQILRTDSAGVLMTDNKILMGRIAVYAEDRNGRKRHYAYVAGDLTVNGLNRFDYDLQVAIPQEFPFTYDLDDIEGIVMDTLYVRGETPPTVSGQLTLVSGKYQVEFAEEETGSPLMLALSGENTWDLNINIEIPANYWIKNEDIDAEFSGFLNIIREQGQYRFVGNLEILRGRGFLFDKTFRIIPGSARVIFEDIEYPNPSLDIWANTRVPLARTEENGQSFEDIKVHVTGNLDNPEFAFFLEGEEDVPIGYEAIVPLIAANYYGDASASGAFEERVSQLISSQVSQIGTRQLGVETFEIDPTYEGYLDLAQTRVTVGKYAGSNLYLWGRSSVEFQELPEAGFEYRISRNLQLEGFRDEDPDKGETYHLNLKMHWEFK